MPPLLLDPVALAMNDDRTRPTLVDPAARHKHLNSVTSSCLVWKAWMNESKFQDWLIANFWRYLFLQWITHDNWNMKLWFTADLILKKKTSDWLINCQWLHLLNQPRHWMTGRGLAGTASHQWNPGLDCTSRPAAEMNEWMIWIMHAFITHSHCFNWTNPTWPIIFIISLQI